MTNKERATRADLILRQQNSGKLSKEEAAARFDLLLDDCGDLHYYSDTTCMRDEWDGEGVMVFPRADDPTLPSNTGIITQGPKRGQIVTQGDGPSTAMSEVLEHFRGMSGRAA